MYLLMDTTQNSLLLSLLNIETEQLVTLPPDEREARQVSQYFFSQLQELCGIAEITPSQITGLAVNSGPGSFTGIRVGLTVARMMAKFHRSILSTLVFNTFELMAATPILRGQSICVLLNAYRGRHYRAVLKITDDGKVLYSEAPIIINNDDLILPPDINLLIEPSLLPLFNMDSEPIPYKNIVRQLPEAMSFLILQDQQRQQSLYSVSFDALLPNYMQLPHITVKKQKPTELLR